MTPDQTEPTTPAAADAPAQHTIVGLFEDTIDAERTLLALRKAHRTPEQISLLVRDRAADENGGAERHGAVARAIVATALDAVGGWLLGLASLIVPERGTFLVAGPLGAALTSNTEGGTGRPPETGTTFTVATEFSSGALLRALSEFGFRDDAAAYLEHRLEAGSALVAVTTADPSHLQSTRQVFADHDAVHIGTTRTDSRIVDAADEFLAGPPEIACVGDIVVTDAVAPLKKLCGDRSATAPPAAHCGAPVVDRHGHEAGTVADLLAEAFAETVEEGLVVRYVVVGFGGVLGLGRHHVAVPADQIALDTPPLRVNVDRDILHRAPSYDPETPFSLREEQAVCAYFRTTPYWATE